MLYEAHYSSPIGLIRVTGTAEAITAVQFVEHRPAPAPSHPLVEEAVQQLAAYFAGTRKTFDLNLHLAGTEFQLRVWRTLCNIPYGKTASYQEIADAIGAPAAVRAVGAANGRNPLAIIVPCHRVIGSNGRLTGYGGGLWRKEWLLHHEGALLM